MQALERTKLRCKANAALQPANGPRHLGNILGSRKHSAMTEHGTDIKLYLNTINRRTGLAGCSHHAANRLLRCTCCSGDGVRHSYLAVDESGILHVSATMPFKDFCRSLRPHLALLANQRSGKRQIAKATLDSQRASSARPGAAACTRNVSNTLVTPIASATACQRGARTSPGLFQQSVRFEGNQSAGVASCHACHRKSSAGCEQRGKYQQSTLMQRQADHVRPVDI